MKMLLALIFTMTFFTACQRTQGSATVHHTPVTEKTFLNVSYGKDTFQRMDVYLPANRTDSTKAIVLIHGGGWIGGDKSEFAAAIPVLQQKLPGYAIFNLNYRLAHTGGNHFPTQENDIQAALHFITGKAEEYTISNDVVLLGASAGAHLALLQAYKYASPVVPKAVVSFFGPTDMADMYNRQSNNYYKMGLQLLVGGTPDTKPQVFTQASPIHFVTKQSPPTLLLHGGRDGLVPVAHSKRLKEKLEAAGVPATLQVYPTEGHGWLGPNLTKSYDLVSAFLNTHVQ